jgi:hypothetical protein
LIHSSLRHSFIWLTLLFSIVAIHGLNPLDTEFHALETWTANGKLWLRDFLPSRATKARIFIFGYNSNVAFQSSTAGVLEQAENLLNRLQSKREVEIAPPQSKIKR